MLAQTSLLEPWENFYVIVGSSAGALTGLQFVVIALIAETETTSSMREIRAFGTPTVVHFCATLLIAAICTAPWGHLWTAALCLGVLGLGGLGYLARVVRQARRTEEYRPEPSDWAWYVAVPITLHALLLASATQLTWHPRGWLFAVAGVALAFLYLGIRNAWDTVTFIAIEHRKGRG